jgi:TolA-binding protein
MTRSQRLAALVLAACLGAPWHAAAQNRTDQQVFLDLRVVQEQTQQLRLSVNALVEQLKTISARLDSEATARSKGFADAQNLINNLSSAVSALQENVRDDKVQVLKLSQELDAIRKGIDILTTLVTQAMAQMPGQPTADPNAPAGAPGAAAPPTGAPAAGGVPASANDYLQAARDDYATGHWDMAIKGFEEFVRRFPTSPDAPRAQFYVGEANYYLGKFKEAVAAYDLVIRNYKSDTEAVADAYYKQGSCYEQLNQKDRAIANYQLILKDYKNTNAAYQAEPALRRLGK